MITGVYIKKGYANRCYYAYISTENNTGGIAIFEHNWMRIVPFGRNNTTYDDLNISLVERGGRNFYKIGSTTGTIAEVIVISLAPIEAIEGHDF